MTAPPHDRLFDVLTATWPAARVLPVEPWHLRQGNGGGQRVSAATAEGAVTGDDITDAERQMRVMGQNPLFMIREGDGSLDTQLAQRDYQVSDPTILYVAPSEALVADLPLTDAMPSWPPLAVQRELWANGGVDSARVAVMERAKGLKTAILGRSGDVPAGTAFVATDDNIAMVHAIEVDPAQRRQGVGRRLMQACANWAIGNGAMWLCLAVTRTNDPANSLYRALGMVEVASYHYRRAPEVTG
ncbi:MAG: GNAT family N-acetyltransferase [Pseudomonadota bacterium]